MDHVNYQVIESIKNGQYLNTKYDSAMRIFPIPHLIVFANWYPQEGKLSEDRIQIVDLNCDCDMDCKAGCTCENWHCNKHRQTEIYESEDNSGSWNNPIVILGVIIM